LADPILRTFQQVKPYLPTLSPAQYNLLKLPTMPPAQAIMAKTGQPWSEILKTIGLPEPLDRDTLSRLSCSLHLLEKRIVESLGLGWDEKTFTVRNHKKMRPDSFCLERAYLQNHQILVLDVKLSISSSNITVYKYLPIFEHPPYPNQMTFFPTWIADTQAIDRPASVVGQQEFFWENNVLYICYLVGKPQQDLSPGSEISLGRVAVEKKKKLPQDMEVKFIEFKQLPQLYSHLAGTECDEGKIAPILKIAERIKEIVLALPKNASKISKELYQSLKTNHREGQQSRPSQAAPLLSHTLPEKQLS
jgi:hypothetical protein